MSEHGLSFDELRETNRRRCETAFHQVDEWKPWEWSNAMAGECGEACNVTKKMNRIWPANQFKQNWNKPEDQRLEELAERLADEVADTVIYADLLLTSIGRSLGAAVQKKFNEKSDEIGSPIKLDPSAPRRAPAPPPGDDEVFELRGYALWRLIHSDAEGDSWQPIFSDVRLLLVGAAPPPDLVQEELGPFFVRDCARLLGLPDEAAMDAVAVSLKELRDERDHLYRRLTEAARLMEVRPGQTTTERASELTARCRSLEAERAELQKDRDKWYGVCDRAWTALDETVMAEPDENLPRAVQQCRELAEALEVRVCELAQERDDARENAKRAFGETAKMLAERAGVPMPENEWPCIQMGGIVDTLISQRDAASGRARELQKTAHALAMLGLQSDPYTANGDYRAAVDAVLALTASGAAGAPAPALPVISGEETGEKA
jgi:NTP pyrophosphatase (non-canonical NTP hydrolase)